MSRKPNSTAIAGGWGRQANGSKVYRIKTERKNINRVKAALALLGLDYTLYYGDGGWKGHAENSMTIELDNINRQTAQKAAIVIKRMNHQEAVLLQEIDAKSCLL